MSRDKNSTSVHLSWRETRTVKNIMETLVRNDPSFLNVETFEKIYNRLNNACRNQDEYPQKMKELSALFSKDS